eukprot:jgi/Mesvir1/19804/Mv13096-RA.1
MPDEIHALEKIYPKCDKYSCPCIFCTERSKIRKECPSQCKFGKISEKRPYTHRYAIMPDGSKVKETDPLTQLWMTSVRMYEFTNPGMVSPEHPDWFDPADFEVYNPKNKGGVKKKLPKTDATAHLPKIMQPRDDEIDESDPAKGAGMLAYYSAWTKSHKCQNVKGDNKEHKSNNTWFEVTKNGVFQRCFDAECTTYRSPAMAEGSPELQQLFKENEHKRASDATASAYRFAYMNAFDPRRPKGSRKASYNKYQRGGD